MSHNLPAPIIYFVRVPVTISKHDSASPRSGIIDRLLRAFTDVRSGEGTTGLILLVNVFLVLTAYYLVKPIREGWLAVSDVGGLSKIELKAYSSFAQSILLLVIVPLYARAAGSWNRLQLVTYVSLFFCANLILFWIMRPADVARGWDAFAGIAFYLWVGIFGVTIVAQFWAFAADFYRFGRGKRLFPMIAIGASAGGAMGSWISEFTRSGTLDPYHLILLAVIPLGLATYLTGLAEKRGETTTTAEADAEEPDGPAAPGDEGVFEIIFGNRYIVYAALLAITMTWTVTNGDNILFGVINDSIEHEAANAGIVDAAELSNYRKSTITAFYGSLYFWVNISALVIQAFFVSRFLKYGGFRTLLFLTPFVSLLAYSLMALVPALAVIRVIKIAENSANYSVNNTARQLLWLPVTPAMIYKAKSAVDTLFVRLGDGFAALTILIGTRMLGAEPRDYLIFNILLVLVWTYLAYHLWREYRRIIPQ